MIEGERQGLVDRDGMQGGGRWWMVLSEVTADTARLGEQCPDLSLEGRATVTVESTGVTLSGTGAFVLDSWTVEGWEAEVFSQSAEVGDFTGTLEVRMAGDDFDEVRWSQGAFGGNDGEVTTEIAFSTR